MKLSSLALAILEFMEELRLVAYFDQHGIPTIGYGHTGPDVKMGMTCTAEQAESWLADDIMRAEQVVEYRVHLPINQHAFDALTLLTYNIGVHAFETSGLLTALNGGANIADMFLQWNHVGGVPNAGLIKRRKLERALYLDEVV